MRKLIVCSLVSADGFSSGPGDNLMAMPFDAGFSDYNAARLRVADALLLGRRTFEMFRAHWPAVADDAGAPPVEREIALLNRAIGKVVVSDSLTAADLAPWGDARIVTRADAHDAVAALKAGEGRDILVFGSRVLWNGLLLAGLVDELHLMIGPALLGEGVPMFEGPRTGLRLVDAQVLDGSQLLLAVYRANG